MPQLPNRALRMHARTSKNVKPVATPLPLPVKPEVPAAVQAPSLPPRVALSAAPKPTTVTTDPDDTPQTITDTPIDTPADSKPIAQATASAPASTDVLGCQQGLVTSRTCAVGQVPRAARHASCATAVTRDEKSAPFCVPYGAGGRCTPAQCSSSTDCTRGACIDGQCVADRPPLLRARAAAPSHQVKGTGPLMAGVVAVTLLLAFYTLYTSHACSYDNAPMLM